MLWTDELRQDGNIGEVKLTIGFGKIKLAVSKGKTTTEYEQIIADKKITATDEYLTAIAKSLWATDMVVVGIEAI